jgi:hypothetical protein
MYDDQKLITVDAHDLVKGQEIVNLGTVLQNMEITEVFRLIVVRQVEWTLATGTMKPMHRSYVHHVTDSFLVVQGS